MSRLVSIKTMSSYCLVNMAEIILYIAVSLDGYIARTDGSVDWLSAVDDDNEDYGYQAFYDSVDALVMGSHSYEQILGFGDWPYAGKTSYVMTSRALSGQRDDVQFVTNDAMKLVDQIKINDHKRVWLVGGGQLASSFHRQGLISEYQLFLIPLTLGKGIPLFSEPQAVKQLELSQSRTYPQGVVELHYRTVLATPVPGINT